MRSSHMKGHALDRDIVLDVEGGVLHGTLSIPEGGADALIIFAHGSGSSRRSPRNRLVASEMHEAGFATLLFDLLTVAEERIDLVTRHLRFDVGLLAKRLEIATAWASREPELEALPTAYFGASTGAAAAIVAASKLQDHIFAVVSRGGRPDLAGSALAHVAAPVLLIVGGLDVDVLELNRQAARAMTQAAETRVEVIPGASHLFEEPGTLEYVGESACRWLLFQLEERSDLPRLPTQTQPPSSEHRET